ncbi:unnamed protein product [Lathyrus sativus]|nr:unnamed protein product [Lathyrus sativus]
MKSSNILVIFTIFSLHCFICLASNSPQDFLDAHNKARAEVGVGPLEWSSVLAEYAQNYANTRIENCVFEHSGGPYGENISAGSDPEMNAAAAVKLWVDEKTNYNHETNSCQNGECLHYTQVVWNNTTHIGCGRVNCKNGWTFIICSYDPPGNYVGDKPY